MVYSERIFHDGRYLIANCLKPGQYRKRKKTDKTLIDYFFPDLYKVAYIKFSVTPIDMVKYIRARLVEEFGEFDGIDEYIARKCDAADKARYTRDQRMWRKAHLNTFNYFYTQTYDSDKYPDEAAFERDFKKTLQNMATRNGWKYFYRPERGKESDRLHFHTVLRVPDTSLIPGNFRLQRRFSHRHKRWEVSNENSFFAAKFGNNDFAPIAQYNSKEAIKYVGKYLDKSGDKIVYSRGLPTYLGTELSDEVVIAEMPVKRQDDVGNWFTSFHQYVTWQELIRYSQIYRWYRDDGLVVLPRAG